MKLATVLFGIVFMGVAASPTMAGKMHAKGSICAGNGCSIAAQCKPHSGVAHAEKSANTGFGNVKVVAHEQAGSNYVTLSVPALAAANGWSASGHAHHHSSDVCVGILSKTEDSSDVLLGDRPPVPGSRGTSQYVKQTWLPSAAGNKINVSWTPDSFLQVDPSELMPDGQIVSRASLTASGGLVGTVGLSASLDKNNMPQIDTQLTGIFEGLKFKLVSHPGGIVSLQFRQPLTWTVPGNADTFDIALDAEVLATPVQSLTLLNLTSTGASIAAGNAACPNQPYFRYVGGKPDNFNGPADSAYPSPDLVTFMSTPPSVQGIVKYDVPMNDGRFGDSFNLQNTRSVCYAVIMFRAKHTGGIPNNDGLTIGHVESGGSPFTVVAQVIDPGASVLTQTYAFDATGRALLSNITGVFADKTPLDSILDVYLQDDTGVDFIQLWVWYGPNCSEINPPTC